MKPYITIIAGIPASGKTTYARHIAKQLHIPLIGKDAIKEKLYDVINYDTSKRENSQLYGAASYSVFFHISECLMEVDVSFVLESNFTSASADILIPLVEKYSYPLRSFCVGEKITVDTTDFSKVDYNKIDKLAKNFIENQK